MSCLLLFTDGSPQEYVADANPPVWHSIAGIGTLLPSSPFPSSLWIPSLSGEMYEVTRYPDPADILSMIQQKRKTTLTKWSSKRGEGRKQQAFDDLIAECDSGRFLFLGHATRSDIAPMVAEQYLRLWCSQLVTKWDAECEVAFGRRQRYRLTKGRLISLAWIAACFDGFLSKARESFQESYVDGLFIHDELPGNNPDDLMVLRGLADARDPAHVRVLTDQGKFDFHPADNFAAIVNDCVSGRRSHLAVWMLKNGNRKPGNMYITCSEADGRPVRFL